MADSYIIQSANVICTNMQVPEPLKIGVSRSDPSVYNTNKAHYFLTVDDKKISESFKCKMAAKKWGGLAMLCAGLAIGGAILLCVATGGLAAPALLAVAITATSTAGIVIGAVGTVGALAYGFYREAHDCDATLESNWESFHSNVLFQDKNALLNSSFMACSVGGKITLIVDDAIAQQAADFISNNNAKEITAQALSKFGAGLVGGLTGGANIPGMLIAIGCDIKFEDGENSTYDMEKFKSETGETITEESIGLGADAIEEGSEMYSITQHNQAVTREMTQYSTDAINAGIAGDASRQASRELAADIASRSFRDYGWKNALKGVGLGLGGAVVGFALEQSVNVYENSLQSEAIMKQKEMDKADNKNNIGVIANKES